MLLLQYAGHILALIVNEIYMILTCYAHTPITSKHSANYMICMLITSSACQLHEPNAYNKSY